jgi:hypothetical protein
MPANRIRQPISITLPAGARAAATAAMAATPVSRKITKPPHNRFDDPMTCAANDGPSDR